MELFGQFTSENLSVALIERHRKYRSREKVVPKKSYKKWAKSCHLTHDKPEHLCAQNQREIRKEDCEFRREEEIVMVLGVQLSVSVSG